MLSMFRPEGREVGRLETDCENLGEENEKNNNNNNCLQDTLKQNTAICAYSKLTVYSTVQLQVWIEICISVRHSVDGKEHVCSVQFACINRTDRKKPTKNKLQYVQRQNVAKMGPSVKMATMKKTASPCGWVCLCPGARAETERATELAAMLNNPPPLPPPPTPQPDSVSALIRWAFLLWCARSPARDKDILTDVPLISGPTSSPSTP